MTMEHQAADSEIKQDQRLLQATIDLAGQLGPILTRTGVKPSSDAIRYHGLDRASAGNAQDHDDLKDSLRSGWDMGVSSMPEITPQHRDKYPNARRNESLVLLPSGPLVYVLTIHDDAGNVLTGCIEKVDPVEHLYLTAGTHLFRNHDGMHDRMVDIAAQYGLAVPRADDVRSV